MESEMEKNGFDAKLTELNIALDLAIEKEKEAIEFYNKLSKRVKNKDLQPQLKKIISEEEKHLRQLKNIDVEIFSKKSVEPAKGLNIVEFIEKKKPSPGMNWKDIISIAMHREKDAMKLYKDLADITLNPKIKQIFSNLSAEESKHLNYFEKIWNEYILDWNW